MPPRPQRATKKNKGKKRSVHTKPPHPTGVNPHKHLATSKPRGAPSKKLLIHLLRYYGVEVTEPQAAQLWEYHKLLREANHDSDLTRLHSFDSMVQRHYADCLLPLKYFKKNWPTPLVDIGSGAGLPGIILKIQSPGTKIILAEPRPRRVDFLHKVIGELGLKNIEVFDHKVTHDSFDLPISGCISRAFASVAKTLELTEPLLRKGGKCILMKGPGADQELETLDPSPFQFIDKSYYKIPHTPQKRSLLVFKR